MIYLNDSSRVWHVAKTGNDANSGHAGQYPVNLANDAKLTISATVSAAADGDTIIIWPGDYAENVDAHLKALNFIGMDRAKTRIVPAASTPIWIGSNSSVKNISAISTSGPQAIRITTATDITIENCYAFDAVDAMYPSQSASRLRLISSHFKSDWDGVNFSGCSNVFAQGCVFETTGAYSAVCHAVQDIGSGIYRDCAFIANSSITSTLRFHAIEFTSNVVERAILKNCIILTSAGTGRTGVVAGVFTNKAGSAAVLDGCLINTSGPGASGGAVDLKNTAGEIIVSGCRYTTSIGVITQGGSNWSSALNNELTGIGLDKAAKLLLNKAVQDKLTGAIRYYDDDGQTIILTHTPDEDESSFTRTVS